MEKIEAIEKKEPAEQAEISAYRDTKTKCLYVPGNAVQQALVAAAAYSKGKGRSTLQKTAAACLLVTPEVLSTGQKEYIIDARAVVVPATGGRVVRYRPRLDEWEISFDITYEENLLKAAQVRRIVDDAGSLCGLLDYRPNRKGPFGRFMVTKWETEGGDEPEPELVEEDEEEALQAEEDAKSKK
jgi:hypothetical protein